MQISESEDRGRIRKLEIERIMDLLFFQVRNLWRVDGLYFLGIEEKFGTDAATEIDANCWSSLAKIEARELKKIFRVVSCKSQEARLKKGLEIFPCKKVRFGYLKSFAEELSGEFEVVCKVCPPDKKPKEFWCEWEFRKK